MKLAMFVNGVATEKHTYSTTRLAMTAVEMGHEVWYIGTEDIAYGADEGLHAQARRASPRHKKPETFMAAVQDAKPKRIDVEALHVLLLRNDPAEDFPERAWAQSIGLIFGQLAVRRGVMVLNDPGGLSRAMNKLYFHHFPAEVRPVTLVTRDADDIRAFVAERDGYAVLKPLQGSGGQGVFLVQPEDASNLNQMVEAVLRDGYVVAQEYLPAAVDGDLRLFLMNGRPLEVDGAYAAFRRVRGGADMRSNMRTGGKAAPAKIDDTGLRIAELVRPQLVHDGMFLVGLDIVGDKLMEINVFSPGGFGSAKRLTGTDFARVVVAALEEKLRIRTTQPGLFDNAELAAL